MIIIIWPLHLPLSLTLMVHKKMKELNFPLPSDINVLEKHWKWLIRLSIGFFVENDTCNQWNL